LYRVNGQAIRIRHQQIAIRGGNIGHAELGGDGM
jgi:hypothetical protein